MPADKASTLVWVRSTGKAGESGPPYKAALVVGEPSADGTRQVKFIGGGSSSSSSATTTPTVTIKEGEVLPRNPPGEPRPDNCQLLHLNEACVLQNVAARFNLGDIYTWTSHVLTAVNPYEALPLYSDDLVTQLPSLAPRDLPPHAFSVAELAVRNVPRGSQSVIVSGESGAGKTTNMAHVMAYLTKRARKANGAAAGNSEVGALGLRLGTLLLQSNPILEAFGNAQTMRNHNSSRFGKFIKLEFDHSGTRMVSMSLKTYLLEKVRIVSPSNAFERTYHIFYALLEGASAEQRKMWGLQSTREHTLTQAAKPTDPGASEGDADTFLLLGKAMNTLAMREEERSDLFGTVAAILHLLDVKFVALDESSGGGCRAVGSGALSHAVKFLGCPGLSLGLTQRVIRTGRGGEPVTIALSPDQAGKARDAVCKTVYMAIFDHLCRGFNEAVATVAGQMREASKNGKQTTPKRRGNESAEPSYTSNYSPGNGATGNGGGGHFEEGPFIGLLDMFGFEIFDVNSFEQLCINTANERLHSFFQQCVFHAEEEIHRLEGVPWPSDLEYQDNSGCVSLVCGSVFKLLDEACSLQNSEESSFFVRVSSDCSRNPFFAAARRHRLREDEGFVIRHFAGDVCYCSAAAAGSPALKHGGGGSGAPGAAHVTAGGDSWLVKNADRLLPELAQELQASSSPFINVLFAKNEKLLRAKNSTSVVRRFVADLEVLCTDLGETHARFIRCIKPNSQTAAKLFDRGAVLSQLRCLGMTEVVQMMHAAYPTRIPYAALHGRYAKGMPPVLAKLPPRDFCEAIALVCDVAKSDFHLGTTRLFLRGGKGAFLEDIGEMDMEQAMPLLLAKIEQMNRRRVASEMLACAMRRHFCRTQFVRQRSAALMCARIWRGARARNKTRADRIELAKKRVLRPAKLQALGDAAAEEAALNAQMAAAHGMAVNGSGPASASASSAPVASNAFDLPPSSSQKPPIELLPARTSALVDETLYASLGVKPLCASQLRAVRALRQRIGDSLEKNTSSVGSEKDEKPRSIRAPSASASQADLDIPARRRLTDATVVPEDSEAPTTPSVTRSSSSSGSSVTPKEKTGEVAFDVPLSRDARDGTLGIDLDSFAGRPTVAVIVPGGPAERDGTVMAGDIIIEVDGVATSSIGDVVAVLSSVAVAAKNPVLIKVLRVPKKTELENTLLVRALPLSALADGIEGISGSTAAAPPDSGGIPFSDMRGSGLHKLKEWKACLCALHSDRRLSITEKGLGVQASFGLRSVESVQLVHLPHGMPDSPGNPNFSDRSCLQIRTPDGVIEFMPHKGEDGSSASLKAWERPLEKMLMKSLSSSLSGWWYNLTANPDLEGSHIPHTFLDLNSMSQLRTLSNEPRNGGVVTQIGIIDLIEIQSIQRMMVKEPLKTSAPIALIEEVLQVTTSEVTCTLACEDPDKTSKWVDALKDAHQQAMVSLVEYTGMILIDGWLEYQGDEDEWAAGFFVLTIGSGLQCFEDAVDDPKDAEPVESIPLETITGAVRSKGIDYYDWCIDVRTTDGDYIRVRPPRQSEMTRWLATLNLYCAPPPKKKPATPYGRKGKPALKKKMVQGNGDDVPPSRQKQEERRGE